MKRAVVALLLLVLFSASVPSFCVPQRVEAMRYGLERVPHWVYSEHPVVVYAYVSRDRSAALEDSVTIEVRTNVSGLEPLSLTTVTRRLPTILIPWGFGFRGTWFVTQIPGLPTKSWILNLGGVAANLTIISKVSYRIVVDGEVVAGDSYVVKEGEKPFGKRIELYATVKNVLENPSLINETMGLAPR